MRPYPWRLRLVGTGPAPAGWVPCCTRGGNCSPLLLEGRNRRADHYHPAAVLTCREVTT